MKKLPDGAVKKTVKEGERIKDDDRQSNLPVNYSKSMLMIVVWYLPNCPFKTVKMNVR